VAFELAEVVPWGRSYDEYLAMFALTPLDLTKRILGCADGPAAFNARLTSYRGAIVSADPLYTFSAAEIRTRIRQVTPTVLEQTRRNADAFVWSHIASVDELERVRTAAMEEFLVDYARPGSDARYRNACLPVLPFREREFDLAVCSHFLFMYGAQYSLPFHIDSLVELCRVATEVRVFPLLELSGRPSRHLDAAIEALTNQGYAAAVRRVNYEFQIGGNEMLTVIGSPESLE
jgi:hypothetical protein